MERFLDIFAALQKIAHGETQRLDSLHRKELKGAQRLAQFAPAMSEEMQGAGRRYARVLLPQRSRRRIARVREDLAVAGLLPSVQRREVSLGHVDFAANLKHVRSALERLRNVADRAHVGGHVLAHGSIPARGGEDQLPMLIA
jgi:hypothetical protein